TGKNTVSVGLSISSSPKARGAPAGQSSIVFPAPPCETAETVDGSGAAAGAVTCANPTPYIKTIIAKPERIFLTKPPSCTISPKKHRREYGTNHLPPESGPAIRKRKEPRAKGPSHTSPGRSPG